MNKKIIKFDDIEIKKIQISQIKKFYFDKLFFGKKYFKYFVGYKDAKKVRLLWCIFLKKISAYRRDFDKTKCMSFMIKDEFAKYSATLSNKNLTVNLYTKKNI